MSKTIPFEFVLEELAKLKPATRPMFGCTAVYVGDKIVFILRDKTAKKADKDSGVWVASEVEHHERLRAELPSLRAISIFGNKSAWRLIPIASTKFEQDVLRACELVLAGDERIGRVPGTRVARSTIKRPVGRTKTAKAASRRRTNR